MASHFNGISALRLRLQAQLGLGGDKTAWLLPQKLRRAMVDPDRSLLQDLVEIDETEMPFRSKHDPVDTPRGGRSSVGKIGGGSAVKPSEDGHSSRIRLAHILQRVAQDPPRLHRPHGRARRSYRYRRPARLREPAGKHP